MAKRRTFSDVVVEADAFLDMPLSAQALYFHLTMNSDDDGFVAAPKKIQKYLGAADDDMKILIAKGYIMTFDSGVIVITHFKLQNTLKNDRYTETLYREEKAQLISKEKVYEKLEQLELSTMVPNCFQIGSNLVPQHNITEHNITEQEIIAQTSSEVSPEEESSPDDERQVVIYRLPLQSTKEHPLYHPVTVSDLARYRELYPAVDVEQAIRSMIGWCEAKPERRKTARGVKAFIANWLSSEQDRGRSPARQPRTGRSSWFLEDDNDTR